MKVSQISKQPAFQAGKITYYSQIPEEIWEGPKPCGKKRKYTHAYKTTKQFLEKYKENIDYIVFSKYEKPRFLTNGFVNSAIPSSVILSNGTDIYIKDKASNSKEFPFIKTPEIINTEKEIIKNTNWDSKTIIEKAKEVFSKEGYIFSVDKKENSIIGTLIEDFSKEEQALIEGENFASKKQTKLKIFQENLKIGFTLHFIF